MAAGRIDGMQNATEGIPPRKKGMPFWKSTLLSVVSALVVLLFWLFYPVEAPEESLQRHLPPECLVVLETHNPQALTAGLGKSGALENLRKLPLWPLVSGAIGRQTGENPERIHAQLVAVVQSAAGAFFGMRNILAAAAGPVGTDGREMAAILCLDNIGLTAAKLALLFGNSHSEGGYRFLRIPAPGKQPSAFFLAIVPETRFLLIASDPQILNRFRFPKNQPIAESFADLAASAGRVSNVTSREVSDDTTLLLQVNADSEMIDRLLLPGQGRALGVHSIKIRFYWNVLEFGCTGAVFYRTPLPPEGVRLSGACQIPDGLRGLALSAALPPEVFTLPLQLAAEAKATGGRQSFPSFAGAYFSSLSGPLMEALANPQVSGFLSRSWLPGVDGRVYAALSTSEGFGLLWGVTDPEKARKAFVTGVAGELAAYSRREKDFAMQMLLSAVKLEPTPEGAVLRLPLVAADSAPYCAFGKNEVGGYGLVRQSRSRAFLPTKNLELPPETLAQAALQWRHSPELIALLRQSASGLESGLLGQMLGESGTKEISGRLPQILQALDILDSLEEISIRVTQLNLPLAEEKRTTGALRWECRAQLRSVR